MITDRRHCHPLVLATCIFACNELQHAIDLGRGKVVTASHFEEIIQQPLKPFHGQQLDPIGRMVPSRSSDGLAVKFARKSHHELKFSPRSSI
ncbi:hypothetical protein PsorP6_000035 [Peronosclerospora sorghi]|uniref:Uncharacterized protein n=1 Tax=Peronosclerospora sorghi TaxID=230839 RepID=A0ACC0WTA7_9STRA|nr:hypothetical protein PsorP6_000035 [Peronosclerospora sorghi]